MNHTMRITRSLGASGLAATLLVWPCVASAGQDPTRTEGSGETIKAQEPARVIQPIQSGQPGAARRERGWIPPVMSMHRTEDEIELRDGIKYVVLNQGSGPDIVDGCFVGLEFNVFTAEGELIYASRQPGAKAAGVKIRGGELSGCKAWEDAMMGMKRFEVRKILIPKEQGPGPEGLGPIPAGKDLVIELGVFAIVPNPDPIVAKVEPDGTRWMDMATGEETGPVFNADGFATFNINVFNDGGELMGSTTIARMNITASGNSERYWVRYAHGMRQGGSRIVEFAEPEPYRKLRLERSLNGAAAQDARPRRWRMLIDCYSVTPPIAQTPHNPSDEKDIGEGVKIVDLVIGEGDVFEGDFQKWVPVIHYSSWSLADNSLYDSSRKPGREKVLYSPLYPSVWKKGLTGMRKGGKRKMIVPPNIDKGQDFTPIQNDRGFVYELELLDWEPTIFQLTAEGEEGDGLFDFNFEDAGDGDEPAAPQKPAAESKPQGETKPVGDKP